MYHANFYSNCRVVHLLITRCTKHISIATAVYYIFNCWMYQTNFCSYCSVNNSCFLSSIGDNRGHPVVIVMPVLVWLFLCPELQPCNHCCANDHQVSSAEPVSRWMVGSGCTQWNMATFLWDGPYLNRNLTKCYIQSGLLYFSIL